jgi:hypothetical protein
VTKQACPDVVEGAPLDLVLAIDTQIKVHIFRRWGELRDRIA